jgi:KamA family protein
MQYNVPEMNGQRLQGIQHKYRETVLFFPTQGQTCHAYCTFCFRWPQFTGQSDLKIAMKQADVLVEYLERHPEVTDLLFTGGDPMIMKSSIFENYIDAILEADLPHLQTIRVGSKTLSFWPYRYLTDNDADDLLRVFERVVKSGRHLAFMAHFNHYNELKTEAVKQAIKRIQNTGAQIRTQAPVLNHINSHPYVWSRMWEEQVNLGMVPYYMFIPRETGAQQYFALPLVQIYEIYRQAYKQVSGICRTVRGPSMSAHPGKIQVLGTPEINGRKTIAMNFIQGRNPDWVKKPFFAKYDEDALWINELEPAFGEDEFFFEEELHAWLVS